jgi:hypothetical protein
MFLQDVGSYMSQMASIQEDGILHNHAHENLKSYICITVDYQETASILMVKKETVCY